MTGVHWYRRRWEESPGGDEDGWGHSTWLFETDVSGAVLRQIVAYDTGPSRRYDECHDEDDVGFLAQVALLPEEWRAYRITRADFEAVWRQL